MCKCVCVCVCVCLYVHVYLIGAFVCVCVCKSMNIMNSLMSACLHSHCSLSSFDLLAEISQFTSSSGIFFIIHKVYEVFFSLFFSKVCDVETNSKITVCIFALCMYMYAAEVHLFVMKLLRLAMFFAGPELFTSIKHEVTAAASSQHQGLRQGGPQTEGQSLSWLV